MLDVEGINEEKITEEINERNIPNYEAYLVDN